MGNAGSIRKVAKGAPQGADALDRGRNQENDLRMPGIFKPLACSISLLCATGSFAENWPYWRGPSHQGESSETGLPLNWSAESNIVWKIEIPGEAWSSPIVFGGDAFVTTATDHGVNCAVIGIDRDTGAIKWNTKVFEQVPLRKEGRNSYATPTPVTDGKAVYAVFGDGSVVAVDAKTGEKLWENREVKFYSQHGLGASPLLYNDLLIMPYDHSSQGENKRVGWQIPWEESFIVALDKNTGKQKWKAQRGKSRIAHVSPNIFKSGRGEILVSGAGDVIQGYRFEDGKQLWSVYSQGEGVVPSIVVGNGLVYSASGFEKPTIRAVRPPAGENGEAEIAWEQRKGVPTIPSFVLHNNLLFSVTTEGGLVSCLDALTGDIIWQERISGNYSSSPVLAEGRIYFTSDESLTTVIEAGREFKVLAKNVLNEKCQSSMAISDKKLFLRTAGNLYCLGEK